MKGDKIDESGYQTFFSGGKSPIMRIYMLFEAGAIIDIEIVNEPPTEPPESLCACCCCGGADSVDNSEVNLRASSQHFALFEENSRWSDVKYANNGPDGKVTDGKMVFSVQALKGEGNFVTNIHMRFECNPGQTNVAARMVGICFEVNFNAGRNRKWFGQKSGGHVRSLSTTTPSVGEQGRPGGIVAVKGQKSGKTFIALEWMCMVFPKVLQMSSQGESNRLEEVLEGSNEYKYRILPQLHLNANLQEGATRKRSI
eukprot:jgi/Bigna1/132491/aug1.17_g7199